MNFRFSALALAALMASAPAFAHIGYGGRNFGNIVNGSNVTIGNQAVTSNYGWADASDMSLVFDSNLAITRDTAFAGLAAANQSTSGIDAMTYGVGVDNLYLGDNHKSRAFRMHLDDTLSVSFAVSAKANATGTSIGGLLPGFSVYKGLAAVAPFTAPQSSADHDFSKATQSWRGSWAQANVGMAYGYGATQGNWNALGDFYVGGEGEPVNNLGVLSYFDYIDSAYDADMNGTASLSLTLGPGDYTIFVGGNDITNKGTLNAANRYGMSFTVTAVPEPETWAMLLAGVSVVALRARRRQSARS
jgi:hypothetical protein